jgi:hypothetical protein
MSCTCGNPRLHSCANCGAAFAPGQPVAGSFLVAAGRPVLFYLCEPRRNLFRTSPTTWIAVVPNVMLGAAETGGRA